MRDDQDKADELAAESAARSHDALVVIGNKLRHLIDQKEAKEAKEAKGDTDVRGLEHE